MAEDWRNPDDYAYLNDYNLHEWAWEFLRRNPEYRKAYFALEAMATKGILQEIERDREKRRAFHGLHEATTEPWGLRMPANPRHNFREARVFFTERAGVVMPTEWSVPANPDSPWPGYPGTLVLKFDLNYSIDVLIEIAAAQLKQCERHIREKFPDHEPLAPKATGRFHKSKFPLYARLLDAELSGASDSQILRTFFLDKADPARSMRKVRETAHRMRAEGYRDLLLRPPHEIGPLGKGKGPDD